MKRSSKQSRRSCETGGEPDGSSVRAAKLASTIRSSIQKSLSRGLGDPRIRGLVSITGVSVSPDLADARVKVSVVPDHFESRVLRGLESATGRFRRELGEHVRLRRIPRIWFGIDRSLKRQAELESIVHETLPEDPDPAKEASDT